jgi:hypothetical protein
MPARDVVAHVCFGDPDAHLAALQELARTQEVDWWTINRHASGGDIALFYITRPVSAFVAWGVVTSQPLLRTEEPWKGYYAAEVSDVRMLPRPISRVELCERLPQWRFMKFPRRSIRVPDEHFERLMALLGIQWQDEP